MTEILGVAPALPLHTAGPYVAAAYIVFLLIVLVYVGIMARRLIANSRELRDLRAALEERRAAETADEQRRTAETAGEAPRAESERVA